MSYQSFEQVLQKCHTEEKEFWQVILEDDMAERNVSEEDSMEHMRATWDAMLLAAATYEGDGRTGGYNLPDSRRHIHGFQDFIGILAPLLKIRYQHRRQYSAGSRRRCRYNTFHAGIGFPHLQSSRNTGVYILSTQRLGLGTTDIFLHSSAVAAHKPAGRV